ncbi:ABC transporter ATP-binding protein [Bilifractor sp. HCP3S3_D3]|uniref:ABC transporter ATP-binding protein n=1 Tax=unclassified Bilifractor TaxID=2815795 RepID=UPI00303E910C|nr:ABC transporter ATP-binding protein [Lachnospiraceae bacterium]
MDVSVKDIGLSYGVREILSSVSFKAENQEFIGLIGPNGSGKSTLLKCIYRVLKPDQGAVYINQKDIAHLSYKQSAREMAVVAQHNYYNFDFSVTQVVLMGRAPHKSAFERDNAEDYRIVREALEKVNMLSMADRSFSTLSGGEQQRVILARALAQKTPCLILDEPTNHLDITYQLELLDIVKSLNITVISAIHDLNMAAMFCDRLYVLRNGQILASGTPEEVLTTQMIREVYHVESQIVYDADGHMHIIYLRS